MANKLNLQNLTLGEVDYVERQSRLPLQKFSDPDAPKTRFMMAMAVVVKRRNGEPTFSIEDAEKLTLSEAQEIVNIDDDDDEPADPEAPATPGE